MKVMLFSCFMQWLIYQDNKTWIQEYYTEYKNKNIYDVMCDLVEICC